MYIKDLANIFKLPLHVIPTTCILESVLIIPLVDQLPVCPGIFLPLCQVRLSHHKSVKIWLMMERLSFLFIWETL